MSETIEQVVKRLTSYPSVTGVIVLSLEGKIIHSSLDPVQRDQYGKLTINLIKQAKTLITAMDETDSLQFLRLKSQRSEIIITPDSQYVLIVLQNEKEN